MLLFGNFLLLRPDFNLALGHLLILIAVILWAAENTLAKYVLKDLSGTLVAFGRMFFGSAFIMVFLAFTGRLPMVWSMSATQYLWIGLTAAFLLLYVLSYYNGLKHINVSTAACVLALGSPITTGLNWLFKDVAVTLHQGVGILLVLLGVVLAILFTQSASHVRIAAHDHGRY
jgi:drug/metabolite transporter (DMT)-like permease